MKREGRTNVGKISDKDEHGAMEELKDLVDTLLSEYTSTVEVWLV